MEILLYIGLMLIVGLVFSKLAKLVRLPNVTGYLVGGLIVGPVLNLLGVNFLSENTVEEMAMISQIALGFIAFTIGTDFRLSYFKRVGARSLIIATFESLGAIIAVFIVLVLIGTEIKFALVLSAIAAATAPAATLMVIKQYKAKGEVTETLMSVVAIDDATAIIFFGICVAIANSVGDTSASIVMMILKPFLEIIISLAFGFVTGLILSFFLKWFTGRSNRISVIVAFIFIAIAFQYLIKKVLPDYEISTLLACMMLGAVFTNTTANEETNKIMELVDRFTPPILIFFFVVSGADLNLTVLTTVGIIGVIYVIMRVVGKIFGAYLGGVLSHSSHKVRKYIGWGLVPQAGVAIGLTLVASNILPPDQAAKIRAVVLSATLIYELIGPFITRTGLVKAGEITLDK
jgi:Kef-type K+ transport system membrane component KefB